MKTSLFAKLTFVLALAVTAAQAEPRSLVVEKIEDGDTLVVSMDGKPERLQLLGIDAPEDAENAKFMRDLGVTGLEAPVLLALGVEATRHLKSLVAPGQTLQASGDFEKRDRYGRINVLISVAPDKASINEAMVADGYAVILRSYPLEEDLKERLESVEARAISTGRGLWVDAYRSAALAWSGRTAPSASSQ